jgi:glycerophosphoryl diester phosphodiesterase
LNPALLSPLAREAWAQLFAPPIAHRGLWSPGGAPENSLAAFEAACEAGYGIELDVQLSKDGEAMVFHDAHLARMAGAAGAVNERTAAELKALRLKNTREPIPTLAEVLALVAGHALILVEIKSKPGEEGPLDQRVADVIEGYCGPLAIIGFNPFSHAWWAAHRPEALRGLNADAPIQREQMEIAQPHFLALGTDLSASPGAQRRRAEGYPIIAWTLRSADQWATAEPFADNLIFEGFAP